MENPIMIYRFSITQRSRICQDKSAFTDKKFEPKVITGDFLQKKKDDFTKNLLIGSKCDIMAVQNIIFLKEIFYGKHCPYPY